MEIEQVRLTPCWHCGENPLALSINTTYYCCDSCAGKQAAALSLQFPTIVHHHSPGIHLIAAERERQIAAEGWTPEHDDRHRESELARAAACYAIGRDIFTREDTIVRYGRSIPIEVAFCAQWPWSMGWWKPADPIRNLVKAGALIAAEIDRLERQKNSAKPADPDAPTGCGDDQRFTQAEVDIIREKIDREDGR